MCVIFLLFPWLSKKVFFFFFFFFDFLNLELDSLLSRFYCSVRTKKSMNVAVLEWVRTRESGSESSPQGQSPSPSPSPSGQSPSPS